MISFTTDIKRFEKDQGEKTGWTYVDISPEQAQQLKPDNKKSFRVKGRLDNYAFSGIALLPMGNGHFIMALNAAIRKQLKKRKGDILRVNLSLDETTPQINKELIECLEDEATGLAFFNQLAPSHRLYFSKWIDSAKTEPTKARRIAHCVNALVAKKDFGTMLRLLKKNNSDQLPSI